MTTTEAPPIESMGRRQLLRTLRESSRLLDRSQVRFLVDLYYQVQRFRIASMAQSRSSVEADEPNFLLNFQRQRFQEFEGDIATAMDAWTDTVVPGRWAKSISGIGPVIAAGMLAHIDIERAETVGKLWSFAGLNPDSEWKSGHRRPWNAKLKVLAWKAGESFIKQSKRDTDIYGHIYAERKAIEQSRNEHGEFESQARAVLAEKKFGKDTEAKKWYEQGKLPPAHIHARARRYAAKMFLSHLHHVMYEDRFGTPPPMPYIFNKPEHTHFMGPPNWPLE